MPPTNHRLETTEPDVRHHLTAARSRSEKITPQTDLDEVVRTQAHQSPVNCSWVLFLIPAV